MSKHLIAFNSSQKKASEIVVTHVEGYIGEMMGKGKDTQHNGVLIVSSERVAFYKKGIFGEVIETIPLKSITSIERRSSLGHYVIEIHTSHDSLKFKSFLKDGMQNAADAIEAGRDKYALTSPTGNTESPLELLKKLGELKAAGILTEEEFDAKKASLLAKV